MFYLTRLQHVPALVTLFQVNSFHWNSDLSQESTAESGSCFMLQTDSNLTSADPGRIRSTANSVSAPVQILLLQLHVGTGTNIFRNTQSDVFDKLASGFRFPENQATTHIKMECFVEQWRSCFTLCFGSLRLDAILVIR